MKANRLLPILIAASVLTTAVAQNADSTTNADTKSARTNAVPASDSEKGLRLNFRGVPLDMVLNYLSEAAGFIIVLETELKGKVDVWSNQALSKEEAVDLLNTVLAKNGYAAIRNGRTLKIVSRDEAKTKDIPVRAGSDPDQIPKNDEMVTQVIPVKYANATQLTQNLQGLLPSYATLTANDSGNALVLTGTQSDIRRMAQIVQALDTSISSISTVKVYPLKYADSKELANAVKELFQAPQQNNNDRRNQFFNRFFGGGGPGGFGGPGGPGGFGGGGPGGLGGGGGRNNASTATGNPNTAASRVVAVADERSNSLVVSAPEDYIPTIDNLVREIDVTVADVTELRVFHLNNADPMDISDIFAELFPDETRTGNNNNPQQDFRFNRGGGGARFGGGPGGNRNFGNNNNQSSESSDRLKKMGHVVAVPDQRTSSVIVSAARDLMPQIEAMIEQLDSSPAKKQKVFVYSLQNADAQQVEQIVRDMFDRSNMSGNRNVNQNSALSTRAQQNQNNQGTATGNSGIGGNNAFGGGGGGGGQGQLFR